jgi:hypothetical protein
VATRTGADEDQAVDALLDRLLGMTDVDDVVIDETTIGVGRPHHLGRRAQARDDDRDLVLHAHGHVLHQAVIRVVADLVDGEGGCLAAGLLFVVVQFVLDALEPFVEKFGRPGIQRRERADDAGLALGDDEFGARDDEEWRTHDGDREGIFQDGWE